jgi:hypothetical protein
MLSILGARVVRTESPALLTVGGTYVDDLRVPELTGAARGRRVRRQGWPGPGRDRGRRAQPARCPAHRHAGDPARVWAAISEARESR